MRSRMGNIRGWGGPTPSIMHRLQMVLQKKIIMRQRMFGIKVSLPAFSGYVPLGMKRVFPNTSFIVRDSWNNFPKKFCCGLFLNSFDPLFREVANRFLHKVIRSYGTDHIYFADPFNEMQPLTAEPVYIRRISYHIYKSMLYFDAKAVWLLQGWMFVKSAFWTHELTKAFLTAVPTGRLLVLDLQSEQYPIYNKTNSFFGQPFIWCMLHNFGGTLGMHGSDETVNIGIRMGRSISNSSMVGVGLTPEGINQNYVIYALLLERAWLKDDINLNQWFNKYSDVRYGVVNYRLHQAWKLLKNSVYSYHGNKTLHGKYILTRRPSTRLQISTWYNASDIFKSWSYLLHCNEIIPKYSYDEYRHDLVDLTRQFLQLKFEIMYTKLMSSLKHKHIAKFKFISGKMLGILSDLEDILATHENFLLGTWLEDAKRWTTSFEEEILFEYNARNQITLWGPNGEIVDYATKQWAGIVKDFYQPRWKLFFKLLYLSLYASEPFNSTIFKIILFRDIEAPFNYLRKIYPTHTIGTTFNVSLSIYLKYVSSFGEKSNTNDNC